MIGDEAWKVFTRDDAAVLVLATLTHDLGMLINIDGFRDLVGSTGIVPPMPEDEAWEKNRREFQLDARRFDGATLVNLLGVAEPVSMNEMEPGNFSERGLKITGEFLRRHHHRRGMKSLPMECHQETRELNSSKRYPTI